MLAPEIWAVPTHPPLFLIKMFFGVGFFPLLPLCFTSTSFLFFYFLFSCGWFSSPYVGWLQQPQDKQYPILPMCVVFPCVQTMKQWYGCQCLGFLANTQLLMQATDTGAVQTPWESLHRKLTLGEKSLAGRRSLSVCWYYTRLFGVMLSRTTSRPTILSCQHRWTVLWWNESVGEPCCTWPISRCETK